MNRQGPAEGTGPKDQGMVKACTKRHMQEAAQTQKPNSKATHLVYGWFKPTILPKPTFI